jgi:hypothetical protein
MIRELREEIAALRAQYGDGVNKVSAHPGRCPRLLSRGERRALPLCICRHQSNVAVVHGLRQKLQQSQELMREMNKSWEEKLLLAERMREEHAKRQEALGVVDQVRPGRT